jgi:hypothetical protein
MVQWKTKPRSGDINVPNGKQNVSPLRGLCNATTPFPWVHTHG